MPFMISDDHLPAVLAAAPMTDDEFAELCEEHPDLMFEMSAEGELIVMAPTHTVTGMRSLKIGRYMDIWAEQDSRGCGCDSSTGFVLPNGARRSPDASWTLRARMEQLDKTNQSGFWHLCPDFVIELKSASDRLPVLRKKMREYMANGAQLGWLINPENRTVTIYRPGQSEETKTNIDSISGEGVVEGFTLPLARIWDPLL